MSGFLEQQAARVAMNDVGIEGCQAVLVADDDLIVTSTNMKNGAYVVAAQPRSQARVSLLATAVGAADTMGTVTIVGTDATGATITEVITPIAGTTVYTTNLFATVTSATGASWVIGEGNDTIKIGVDYSVPPVGYYFFKLQVLATTVVASQTNATGAINPKLATFTGLPVNAIVYGKYSAIQLTSGECIGYYARG